MSWEYSENILVQNSAGNVLETRLGWDVVFAYNTEVLGENGTLGRKTYHDIILTRYLKKALFENNDWMHWFGMMIAIMFLAIQIAMIKWSSSELIEWST